MKVLQGFIGLSALYLLAGCEQVTEKTLRFDVPYGYYETAFRQDVWEEKKLVEKPGFAVRHVSVHASGMKGGAVCELRQ